MRRPLRRRLSDGRGTVLPIWRGKPLMQSDDAGSGLSGLRRITRCWPMRRVSGCSSARTMAACALPRISCVGQPEAAAYAPLDSFADDSLQVHPAAAEGQVFRELRLAMTQLSARDAELAATAKAMLGWHRSHRFCARCGAESRMAQAGWQRVCPDCGAQHFPRTDPVVIMLITHGNDVLLGRSPAGLRGCIRCWPASWSRARRSRPRCAARWPRKPACRWGRSDYLASQPWPYPSSLMFGCIGQAQSREITIDPVELEDALWISREDLAEAMAGRHPTLLPARRGAIAHFLLENWLADRLD